jgi:hypothetical protein
MIERMFSSVVERQVLPGNLDTLPPGPILAGFLFRIDRTRLNGHDLVVVMQPKPAWKPITLRRGWRPSSRLPIPLAGTLILG